MPLVSAVGNVRSLKVVRGNVSDRAIVIKHSNGLHLDNFSVGGLHCRGSRIVFRLTSNFSTVRRCGLSRRFGINPRASICNFYTALFGMLVNAVPTPTPTELRGSMVSVPTGFTRRLPHRILSSLTGTLRIGPSSHAGSVRIFGGRLICNRVPNITTTANRGTITSSGGIGGGSKGNGIIVVATVIAVVFVLLVDVVLLFAIFHSSVFNGGGDGPTNAPSAIVSRRRDARRPAISRRSFRGCCAILGCVNRCCSSIVSGRRGSGFVFVVGNGRFSGGPHNAVVSRSITDNSHIGSRARVRVIVDLNPGRFGVPGVLGGARTRTGVRLLGDKFLCAGVGMLPGCSRSFTPNRIDRRCPTTNRVMGTSVTMAVCMDASRWGGA